MPERSALTLTLHAPSASGGHRFGINAVGSCAETGDLYTAGRDGTVRCWSGASAGAAETEAWAYEAHADWVNDLCVLRRGVVATASSDCTVRLHTDFSDASKNTPNILGRHDDYAKGLAYASEGGLLASAGFDRRLLLWDVHRFEHGKFAPVAASEGGHTDSIYALHTNAAGTMLATGSVDTDVRLWDPRDLSTSLRLRGHSDVVRCVRLLSDGVRVLSCGSDSTIRVWHIGERRCEMVRSA